MSKTIELSEEELLLIEEKRKKDAKKQKTLKEKIENTLKKYGPLVTEIEKSEEFKNMKFVFDDSFGKIKAKCGNEIVITYYPNATDERRFEVINWSKCSIPRFGNDLQNLAHPEFKELFELRLGDYAIKISNEAYESGFGYSYELIKVSHVSFFRVLEYKDFLKSKDTGDNFRSIMSVRFGDNRKIDILVDHKQASEAVGKTNGIKNNAKDRVYLFGTAAKKFIKDLENVDDSFLEDIGDIIYEYFNSNTQMEFSFI